MSRRRITKVQKEQLERYQRGLSSLHGELSQAKTPEAVLSICQDIHDIANNMQRLVEPVPTGLADRLANRGTVTHPV